MVIQKSSKDKMNDIKEFISYEKGSFIFSAILLPVFIILGYLLCQKLYELQMDSRNFRSMDLHTTYIFLMLLSFVAWIVVTCLILREKWYAFNTDGRSYSADHGKTKKGYSELFKFYTQSDSHKMLTRTLPVANWYDSNCIPLGHLDEKLISIPTDGDGYNTLVTGLPSVGKSSAIAIPAAMQFGYAGISKKTGKPTFNGSVFALDYKGDISLETLKAGRHIKFFEPECPETSCHFNPFKGLLDMEPDFQRDLVEKLADIIIPEEKRSSGDNYWRDTAIDFFCGACFLLLSQNPNITFPDVVHYLLHTTVIDLIKSGCASESEICQEYLSAYYGNNEKNIAGAMSALVKKIRGFSKQSLYTLLDGRGDCISVDTLSKGYDVYIRVSQEKKTLYYSIISVITMQFLDGFKSRGEGAKARKKLRPVLFLLDELPVLKLGYEFLQEACSTLRSKRISILMLQQSLSQWKDLYGESGATTLLGDCQYICTMTVNDPYTRNTVTDLIGSHTLYRESWTVDGKYIKTQSFTEAREKIYQPEDLGDLNDKVHNRHYVVIYAFGKYITAEQCRFYDSPRYKS